MNLKKILIFLFFTLTLICCLSQGNNDNNEKQEPDNNYTEPSVNFEEQQIDGGYSEIAADSELVVKSYDFLKEELSQTNPEIELLEIKTSRQQVVSGYKVELTCGYKNKQDETVNTLMANIYHKLSGEITLLEINLNF